MDPAAAYASLAAERRPLMLASASARPGEDPALAGRWSFVMADPMAVLTGRGWSSWCGTRLLIGDALRALRSMLERCAVPRETWEGADEALDSPLPPFRGGLAGFFGYELGGLLERLPPRRTDDLGLPDLALGAYDAALAIDHATDRAYLVASGVPARTPGERLARAESRLAWLHERLDRNRPLAPLRWNADSTPVPSPVSTFDRPSYEAAVARVIELIGAGDAFQVNLSQRFGASLADGDDALALFRRLAVISPVPFAALIDLGDAQVVSASPELFLRVIGRTVETKPIKGTRPRGVDPRWDAQWAAELLASGKDRAENVMIVDLLRNDLSRVCEDGSVQVPRLCALESYANVHHLVSTVTGTLRPGADALDLLRASFPGGSITGAPKVRAMEIIAELEPTVRGPYCGALGYLGFDGDMDLAIAIRTAVVRDGRLYFHAGGGITAESDPAMEYEETIAKVRPFAAAAASVRSPRAVRHEGDARP